MEHEMEYIPNTELETATPRIADVAVDTHFDFKLEGWSASVALITLCLSCVMVYGITVWGKARTMQISAVTT